MIAFNPHWFWLIVPLGVFAVWGIVAYRRETGRARGSRWATWLDDPKDPGDWVSRGGGSSGGFNGGDGGSSD